MKVHIIENLYDKEDMDKIINDFIEDKKVIDIKFNSVFHNDDGIVMLNVLIMYEDLASKRQEMRYAKIFNNEVLE